MSNRPLPANHEAESAVLGAVFIDPRCWPGVAGALKRDSFADPNHQHVFAALGALAAAGLEIDVLTVEAELGRAGVVVHGAGGAPGLLVDLARATPIAENVTHYTRIVADAAAARRVVSACRDHEAKAYTGDVWATVESLGKTVSGIVVGGATALETVGDGLAAVLADMEGRSRGRAEGLQAGVRFGLSAIDDKICGVRPGELCVIGGYPGAGKSALAQQAAETLVLVDAGSAIVFALEMSAASVRERALARAAKVNSWLMRNGDLTIDSWRDIQTAAAKLHGHPLYLEDRCFELREIIAKARAWRARESTRRGLVVVDFLQMIRDADRRGEPRHQAVGRFAYALKGLAKELAVAVIAVSTLERSAAKTNETPTMHHLKESGDIEYAADEVLLLHNEHKTDNGSIEAILGKFRNGQPTTRLVHWTGKYYEFTDVQMETRSAYAD